MGRGSADQVLYGDAPPPAARRKRRSFGCVLVPAADKAVFLRADEAPEAIVYPGRSLVIVGGLPGVGKTTLLDRIQPDAAVVSVDEIYEQVPSDPGLTDRALHTWVHHELQSQCASCLAPERGGRSVIIDAPALYTNRVSDYIATANQAGVKAHLLLLTAPPHLCHARRADTGRPLATASWRVYEGLLRRRLNTLERGELEGLSSAVVLDGREAAEHLQHLGFDPVRRA